MFERAASSILATTAACAAAALAVFASGFALYAFVEPALGPPGAAAVVAALAALAVAAFALFSHHRVKQREQESEGARAALLDALPLGLGDLARERPIATLIASILGGAVAARHPRLVRDLISIIARVSDR